MTLVHREHGVQDGLLNVRMCSKRHLQSSVINKEKEGIYILVIQYIYIYIYYLSIYLSILGNSVITVVL